MPELDFEYQIALDIDRNLNDRVLKVEMAQKPIIDPNLGFFTALKVVARDLNLAHSQTVDGGWQIPIDVQLTSAPILQVFPSHRKS